ncbi:SMI1/KNR4 family protein [Kitasatospora sp. NPDC051853]|uniref:SMI1/KNR4 family protein n=1 Tax=Kitasatospora sp. NPDC051853 TaxID=3364058 RepID=UPI0037BCBE6A
MTVGGTAGGPSEDDLAAARVRSLTAAVVDGTTATADRVRGLSGAELDRIERDQAAPLGAAYRCFLERVGGGAGHFLRGTDVFHPRVIGLGAAARELLAENDVPFALTDSDRVFLMHQGYQFEFLRGPGPDPEVWSYCEGGTFGDVPTLRFARFTDWLRAQVTAAAPAELAVAHGSVPPCGSG